MTTSVGGDFVPRDDNFSKRAEKKGDISLDSSKPKQGEQASKADGKKGAIPKNLPSSSAGPPSKDESVGNSHTATPLTNVSTMPKASRSVHQIRGRSLNNTSEESPPPPPPTSLARSSIVDAPPPPTVKPIQTQPGEARTLPSEEASSAQEADARLAKIKEFRSEAGHLRIVAEGEKNRLETAVETFAVLKGEKVIERELDEARQKLSDYGNDEQDELSPRSALRDLDVIQSRIEQLENELRIVRDINKELKVTKKLLQQQAMESPSTKRKKIQEQLSRLDGEEVTSKQLGRVRSRSISLSSQDALERIQGAEIKVLKANRAAKELEDAASWLEENEAILQNPSQAAIEGRLPSKPPTNAPQFLRAEHQRCLELMAKVCAGYPNGVVAADSGTSGVYIIRNPSGKPLFAFKPIDEEPGQRNHKPGFDATRNPRSDNVPSAAVEVAVNQSNLPGTNQVVSATLQSPTFRYQEGSQPAPKSGALIEFIDGDNLDALQKGNSWVGQEELRYQVFDELEELMKQNDELDPSIVQVLDEVSRRNQLLVKLDRAIKFEDLALKEGRETDQSRIKELRTEQNEKMPSFERENLEAAKRLASENPNNPSLARLVSIIDKISKLESIGTRGETLGLEAEQLSFENQSFFRNRDLSELKYMAILDFLYGNEDHHRENTILRPDGSLAMIDFGASLNNNPLPSRRTPFMVAGLSRIRDSQIDGEQRDMILEFDFDKEKVRLHNTLQAQGVTPEEMSNALRDFTDRANLLRQAAIEGLTYGEVSRRIWQ